MSKRWMMLLGLIAFVAMGQPVQAMAKATCQDRDQLKEEFKKKDEAVDENDAGALFELAMWAEANGLKSESRRTLRKVIRVDKDHEEARKLLGYVKVDGDWVTEREAERLKKKAEEAEKEAMGLRKWKDGEWYPAEEVEKMEQGLFKVKLESGEEVWVSEREKGYIEKGLVPYKGQWIKKEDKEKIDQGLFPVEGKWLTKEEADEYHNKLETPWLIDAERAVLTTTCKYDFGEQALLHAKKAIEKTYEVLGLPIPEEFAKVNLVLVNTPDEYNMVGNGAQDEFDANMSSGYGCFSMLDPERGVPVGVVVYSVLDETQPKQNDNYTLWLVRHAAAEAAVRAIPFQEPVPRWFVTGLATYCERYWDPFNPNGTKQLSWWSADNLRREGGAKALKSFFQPFSFSRQNLLQSGIVLSFLLSDQVPEKVAEQWAKVKELMASDKQKGLEKEFIKLETVLAKDGQKAFEAYVETVGSK